MKFYVMKKTNLNNEQNSDDIGKENNIENKAYHLQSVLLKHLEHSTVSEKGTKTNLLLPRRPPHSCRIRRCKSAYTSKLGFPFNNWTNISYQRLKRQSRWSDEVSTKNEMTKLFLFYFGEEMCLSQENYSHNNAIYLHNDSLRHLQMASQCFWQCTSHNWLSRDTLHF